MGNLQPCLLHTKGSHHFCNFCSTFLPILSLPLPLPLSLFFCPVTVLNVQFPIFSGPHLKDMKNIQVYAERLWELCPTQHPRNYIRLSTRLQAAKAPCTVCLVCWGGWVGGWGGVGKKTVCAMAKSVHKEKHPKNNYSAANTACNPLKPREAGHS